VRSSAVEHCLDTAGVTGSIPVAPTKYFKQSYKIEELFIYSISILINYSFMILNFLTKFFLRLVIILLITFILIEISFRLVPKSIIPNLGPNKINIDLLDYGPWFYPNQKTSYSYQCGFVTPISINKFGMRDISRKLIKNNETLRVALLGDSVTEGLHVPDFKYTSYLIEKKLNSLNNNVEVLNFSFSGYGTAQQLALYKKLVKKFRPDIVLLFTTSSNDLRNNSIDYDYLSYGFNKSDYGVSNVPPFSYYEFENNELKFYPNLRKNSYFKSFIKQYLLHNFYSIDYLKNLILSIQRRQILIKIKKIENLDNQNNKKNNLNLAEKKLEEKTILYKNKAIINTNKIVEIFKKEVEKDEAKLIQVIYNNDREIAKIFEKIANKNEIDYLVFGPEDNDLFDKYLINNNILLEETHPKCDAHPNELGHKINSEIITNWLLKSVFL
jgi:hypothetical protein